MSNINVIVPERAAEVGSFLVGRLLPFRKKRMIGPFIFIDHMGPVEMNKRENFDVLPHPHIGLSTLTFLFEGSIMHRDTLGTEIEIKPGAVNWMTAGEWVVHSERTPDYLRNSKQVMHGLQIWVALPKEIEKMPPEFHHIDAKNLPVWKEKGIDFKLIAGEVMERKSPVPVHSALYMIEIKADKRQKLNIGNQLYGESAIYILEGQVEAEGEVFKAKQLLVAKEAKLCEFTVTENSTVYLFGGNPLPEKRYIDWNFVASEQDIIDEAKEKWMSEDWEPIETDPKEHVPYPTKISKNK